MVSHYLVVYDIADLKRLRRVALALSDYGERVQESVFEIRLDDARLKALKKLLLSLIDEKEDGIKIFRLCEICLEKMDGLGCVRHLQKAAQWSII